MAVTSQEAFTGVTVVNTVTHTGSVDKIINASRKDFASKHGHTMVITKTVTIDRLN